ncbi:flagellar FliL protein [Solimonas aquatica]|uniref:Flagellar protein FliL n=1 Tax=Solimonas aquatica TaxID=489703 RepID=A0A1H9HK47_9GAMM|nr:flagellar basal body-associated FliL family protein [Solimonas aquatica]SEQ62636.1 flagellar FliL protein [Solimonas aquatica]
MSKAEKEPAEGEAAAAKPKKNIMGLLLPILISAVVASAAAGGVSFFIAKKLISEMAPAGEAGHEGDKKKEEEHKGPTIYVPMEPPFVVNIDDNGTSRFLQVAVQMSTHDPKGAEEIKGAEPRIRNDVLMLFSQQKIEELSSPDGKEKLRVAVLAAVQKILEEELGKPTVEGVYFTSFVIQ